MRPRCSLFFCTPPGAGPATARWSSATCRRRRAASAGSTSTGDRDGDGFQEYQTRSSRGYENMGWKDSGDGVLYPDGSLVKGPKALCELQGYVYAAWLGMAEIFDDARQRGARRGAARQGGAAVRPVQRRVLGRGVRLLCLCARRRQAAGAHPRLERRPLPVDRHRAAQTVRARVVERLLAPGHVQRLGHSHADGRASGVTIRTPITTARSGRTTTGSSPWASSATASPPKRRGWRGRSAAPASLFRHAPDAGAVRRYLEASGHGFPGAVAGRQRAAGLGGGLGIRVPHATLGLAPDAANGRLHVDPALPSWLPDLH